MKKVNLKNKKILEIGCGDGFRTKQFSKVRGVIITAIDPNARSISFAKKKFNSKNITYLVAKAEKLPFKEKDFDIVVFTLSLHHIKLVRKALQEARKVLKDKGLIVIIGPGFEGTIFQAENIFGCFDGDERKIKAKTYQVILQDKKMKEKAEFWGKTEWQFDSLSDFKKNMHPKNNIPELKDFLNKNNYKLWGERRINVFKKI